jgi:hypothetical protein
MRKIKKNAVSTDPLDLTQLDELDQQIFDTIDTQYQSELEYDGYHHIEDLDNHINGVGLLGRKSRRNDDPEAELEFEEQA